MFQRLIILWAFTFCNHIFAGGNAYHYYIDLNDVHDGKLAVSLIPPDFNSSEVLFHFPSIVPGTYAIYNFGRFVSDFAVLDKNGNRIATEHLDTNTWKISNAKNIQKITYRIKDTWRGTKEDNYVFEPGGTNIQKDTNFVINTHGFLGYFEGYKQYPFHLEFKKPQKFYGSTAMEADENSATTEKYTASDYMRLVDSPIMFCIPDTTTFLVGNSRILVSVYSMKDKSLSKVVADNIRTTLNAQKEYLGGQLPIDKYAFIIYLFSGSVGKSGSYGALEHSYSSFYFLPEMKPELIGQNVRDIAGHEFFHIITPLSIHSEEIGNFDYNNPKMSQHLWLYEGVTEYFAGNVQAKEGLMKLENYVDVIHDKIEGKESYNDTLPFTEMSLGCLDKYKKQYENVYVKGALIGLCLDIKLLALSNGKYGLRNLMFDLSKTYGKNKSFKDDELFGEIVKLTYPEIGDFLQQYVSGKKPLPLKEILNLVGIDYTEFSTAHTTFPFTGLAVSLDPESNHFYIDEGSHFTDFSKSMGLAVGDEILKINGRKLKAKIFIKILGQYEKAEHKAGEKLTMVLIKKDDGGKNHKLKINTRLADYAYAVRDALSINKNPTEQQLVLRKAWAGSE